MSLNQNGFSLRVLNNLGIEVDKVSRKNCKIVDQLKANRVKGWVLQRVKFMNFSFFFFKLWVYLFIYLWLCWIFVSV